MNLLSVEVSNLTAFDDEGFFGADDSPDEQKPPKVTSKSKPSKQQPRIIVPKQGKTIESSPGDLEVDYIIEPPTPHFAKVHNSKPRYRHNQNSSDQNDIENKENHQPQNEPERLKSSWKRLDTDPLNDYMPTVYDIVEPPTHHHHNSHHNHNYRKQNDHHRKGRHHERRVEILMSPQYPQSGQGPLDEENIIRFTNNDRNNHQQQQYRYEEMVEDDDEVFYTPADRYSETDYDDEDGEDNGFDEMIMRDLLAQQDKNKVVSLSADLGHSQNAIALPKSDLWRKRRL